ncbi:hypothetical protein IAR50_000039 [Cryptococcus sp. DSM 104548]
MADSPSERRHWQSVIRAFDGYQQYHMSAQHARRMSVLTLPKAEKEVYKMLGYMDKVDAVDEGIRQNQEFLEEMISNPVFSEMLTDPEPADAHTHDQKHPHSHDHGHGDDHSHSHGQTSRPVSPGSISSRQQLDAAQDKVRSTLRSFVRDWSSLGQPERDACYTPCLEALEKWFPSSQDYPEGGQVKIDVDGQRRERKVRNRGEVRVLVPGCGLGRLAMEIASQGFTAQGNEFSTYMLIASDWVLNQTTQSNSHTIYPFLHSFSNHLTTEHHLLLSTTIPDVCPTDVFGRAAGSGKHKPGAFSLVAGDFEEIYGKDNNTTPGQADADADTDEGEDQSDQWDAIVTCFFIDCSRNILNYLRIIHALLPPSGIWINIGPLLWHFENSPTTSIKGERSVELSLNEVKQLGEIVGFEFREEKMIKSTYTSPPEGMLRHEYTTAFWVATKKEPQVLIQGNKVLPNPKYTKSA